MLVVVVLLLLLLESTGGHACYWRLMYSEEALYCNLEIHSNIVKAGNSKDNGADRLLLDYC